MEGRLVPPEPGRFQSFPRQRWEDEFALAREVPLSFIEWIYDLYGADENPLTNDLDRLRSLSRQTGVTIRSVCADYFMDLPFLRCSPAECTARQQRLNLLLGQAAQVGVSRVVLPFVDASRIETAADEDRVVEVLKGAIPKAKEDGVELHLETDLSPRAFAALLSRVPEKMIQVNYDSGNSSSLGFAPAEEFEAYGERIGSIHIKDRVRGGGTVPLGTGDADFRAVFDGMERIHYTGDITMQVARSEPGREVAWARKNRAFIERFWAVE